MLSVTDISDILRSVKADWPAVSEADIAFAVLCESYSDKDAAFRAVYGKAGKADGFLKSKGMVRLRKVLESYGIGGVCTEDITQAENKGQLVKMIGRVENAMTQGEMDVTAGMKLITDIRIKLQDKFDMEQGDRRQRIIIVPAKHDYICPHTNRECTKMPTKEACMRKYNLVPAGSGDTTNNNIVSGDENER